MRKRKIKEKLKEALVGVEHVRSTASACAQRILQLQQQVRDLDVRLREVTPPMPEIPADWAGRLSDYIKNNKQ